MFPCSDIWARVGPPTELPVRFHPIALVALKLRHSMGFQLQLSGTAICNDALDKRRKSTCTIAPDNTGYFPKSVKGLHDARPATKATETVEVTPLPCHVTFDSDAVGDPSCRVQGGRCGDPSPNRLGCEPLKGPPCWAVLLLWDTYPEVLMMPLGVLSRL